MAGVGAVRTAAGGSVFDGVALGREVDRQRAASGLQRPGVAESITAQSVVLRTLTGDHDACSGGLARTVRCGTMSCPYALLLLRRLDRVPEDFLTDGTGGPPAHRLPPAGPHQRLRWLDSPSVRCVRAVDR